METPSVSDFFAVAELDPMLSVYSFDAGIEGEDFLDENTNHFETFNPEHDEHLPGYPWADSENVISQPTYTENCPYKTKDTSDDFLIVDKKFRLVEEFPDGLVYTGDSYGSHSYIDANDARSCPQSCFCWSHDQAPGVFTFVAHKSSSQMVVNIYSDALYSEIIQVTDPEMMAEEESIRQNDFPKSLNGFRLLQSFQNLQAHLNILRCYAFTDPSSSPIISEMELLVHGFLADGEVFKSFGYEHLYENGFLTFERWKAFQQDQLQKDISTLDKRFIAVDDSNDFEDSQVPVQLFGISSEDFEAVETHPDENPKGSSQSFQYCVAEANAIQEGRDLDSSHVLELSKFEDLSTVREDTNSEGLCPNEVDSVDAQNGDNHGIIAFQWMWHNWFTFGSQETIIQKIFDTIETFSKSDVRIILDECLFKGTYDTGVRKIPLIEAAYAGYKNIVQLLPSRGAALDIDLALISAARAGQAAVVSLLLSHNRATNDFSKNNFWYLASKVLDVEYDLILGRSEFQTGELARSFAFLTNSRIRGYILQNDSVEIHNERCSREVRGLSANDIALIEAAAAGHEEVVKILLDNGAALEGADVLFEENDIWTRERRVPVVEAAKAGHGAVMRLLLQRGAVVSSLQPLMSPFVTTKEDPTIQRLNKRFFQQYQLMTDAMLGSSANFSQLGTRFKNHTEAWSAGISTMRRLCNGKPPRGLQNTAAFLCISRAMSETLDSINGSNYTSQFLEDLERWQVLFASKERELYRELIHSMWGIVLPDNKSKSWNALDFLTLTYFQALLSTLIRQTNEPVNLHIPHDQSLRCSQQRFLARSHQTSAEPEIDLPTENLDLSEGSNPQPTDDIEPKPPDIPIAAEKIPLKEHIENDISAASLNFNAVFLMAGAIFAIVIVFLQWLRDLSNGFYLLSMTIGFSYNVDIHDLQHRCLVLTTYLGLKADSAVPSSSSIATRSPVVDPFGESSPLQFSVHGSQSMASPNEPEFAQQGALSSPHANTFYNTPLSNSAHGTALSSSKSTQTSPSTQHSNPTSTKPLQKPRRTCPTCKKKILATNLKRHLKDHSGENRVNCCFCGKSYGRKEYLQRHERERCRMRRMDRKGSK